MEKKSYRLSVEELVLAKWMLGALMGLVSVCSIFSIGEYAHTSAWIAVGGIGLSLLWPGGFAKLPAVAWKIYAFGIIPLMTVDIMARETVPALLNLNIWLIIYRSLNHEKRREEMQLVLLCLFLMIMAGILTSSLVFGFQLLVFAGLAICFLIAGEKLQCKLEGTYSKPPQRNEWGAGLMLGTLNKVFRFRVLLRAGGLFASLLILASLIFMVIPRVDMDNKISLLEMQSSGSVTGFSDSIALGDVTRIKNDDSVALRIDVENTTFLPETLYLRMLALDTYRNGSFALSPSLRRQMLETTASTLQMMRYWPSNSLLSQVPSSDIIDRWTIFMEPGISAYLPLLGSFQRMTFDDPSKLFISAPMHVISLEEPSSQMVSFQLEGVDLSSKLASSGKEGADPLLYDEAFRLRELPQETAALRYLRREARKLKTRRDMPALEFARNAKHYLESSHAYSMEVALPGNSGVNDPVVRWMQSDLPGHCEFFASATVLLCRAAGYPARTVVGFKGGTWNSYEEYFMVRNSDAHAWCEVYDGEGGWIRVDPTPGSLDPGYQIPTVSAAARIGETGSKAYLDSLKMLWYRRIVHFDEDAQKGAAVRLKDFMLAYAQVAENWAMNTANFLVEWAKAPWSFWRILYFASLGMLLLIAIAIQRNLALNYRELISAPFRRGDPIRRKAGKLIEKLDARSPRRRNRGRSAESSHIRDALQRLRYGERSTWPNPRHVFKDARRWL